MKRVGIVFLVFIGIVGILVLKYRTVVNLGPALLPSDKPAVSESKGTVNQTGWPLTIPDGFGISIFASGVNNARDLEFDSRGSLLASQTSAGKITVLPEKKTVLSGLNKPHGMVIFENKIYVTQTNKVSVWDYDAENQLASNQKDLFNLPTGGNHFTRSLIIKDRKLYISIGSTCNVCNEKDAMRAAIYEANLDGSGLKLYARGLRNSVFMAVRPDTSELWATEMGRDLLGNDVPPDEINIIREGKNYGWPICYGKNIHDTQFDRNTYIRNPCMEPTETESLIDIPAHSAPLGLAFVPDSWPSEYRGKLLVSYHGSWNRNPPTGYKIVLVDPITHEIKDFISSFLGTNNRVFARPVDLIFDSEGNLYVSDDKGGMVLKVSLVN